MPAYHYPARYPVPEARDRLIAAALRCIAADHYANDADPNADAQSEYAADQVALAARALVGMAVHHATVRALFKDTVVTAGQEEYASGVVEIFMAGVLRK